MVRVTQDKMLTRIGGLLRQAESTDNPHEAEAFMAAAQRLATTMSIDLAVARAHTAERQARPTPTQRVIDIGEPGRKGLRTYVELFVWIARANDVTCDVTRTSTQVFAYGFDGDIDTCQALYSSLVVQMVRSCDAYLASGEHRDATAQRVVTRTVRGRRVRRVEDRPLATITARLEFQSAFAERIGARLAEARTEAIKEHEQQPSSGTTIALRNKDIELTDYYRSHSRARGTWRNQTASYSQEARDAGDSAGRRARLGGSTELPGARGKLPR